jgi:hypothetical protein
MSQGGERSMGFWDKLIGTKARSVYAFFFTAFVFAVIMTEVPDEQILISSKTLISIMLASTLSVVAGYWIAAKSVSEEMLEKVLIKALEAKR